MADKTRHAQRKENKHPWRTTSPRRPVSMLARSTFHSSSSSGMVCATRSRERKRRGNDRSAKKSAPSPHPPRDWDRAPARRASRVRSARSSARSPFAPDPAHRWRARRWRPRASTRWPQRRPGGTTARPWENWNGDGLDGRFFFRALETSSAIRPFAAAKSYDGHSPSADGTIEPRRSRAPRTARARARRCGLATQTLAAETDSRGCADLLRSRALPYSSTTHSLSIPPFRSLSWGVVCSFSHQMA